jgi:hypothetical protein
MHRRNAGQARPAHRTMGTPRAGPRNRRKTARPASGTRHKPRTSPWVHCRPERHAAASRQPPGLPTAIHAIGAGVAYAMPAARAAPNSAIRFGVSAPRADPADLPTLGTRGRRSHLPHMPLATTGAGSWPSVTPGHDACEPFSRVKGLLYRACDALQLHHMGGEHHARSDGHGQQRRDTPQAGLAATCAEGIHSGVLPRRATAPID